jgi:polyether ionophore transport system permease protein
MTMATVAAADNRAATAPADRAFAPLLRRSLRDSRMRVLGFAYLFAAVSYLQPVAYRHTYPSLEDRVRFAQSFAHNKAVVLFYGKAYDLLTVGGYSAWRVGGTLTIFAAVFGLLAAVRATRAEEDSGRAELVLAAVVGRATRYTASITAIAVGAAVLWLAAFAGLLLGGLPGGGSAYLALAVVSVVPVFAGAGALVSQFAPNRRMALELGGAMVAVSFLLRVIADTSSAGWLRWATPLGWAEELHPFTGARPVVLLLPLATAAVLLLAAARIEMTRDLGTGLLAPHDSAEPRMWLLSSPTAQALRAELGSLMVWLASVAALALVIGIVSKSVSSLGISKQLERTLEKLGAGSVLTPIGYIGFSFSFFALIVSLLAVSQVAAARHEESEQRLETLLSLPVSRRTWLGGRLELAAACCAIVGLGAGVFAWLGATAEGVSISLPRMLEAGLNCLPVALLVLGLAALAYALLPRAGTAIGYGLVVVAYLWQLFGSLLGAPRWLVDATPFAHVGAVPAQPFRVAAALVMVAIGALAGLCAIGVFARRDLMSA